MYKSFLFFLAAFLTSITYCQASSKENSAPSNVQTQPALPHPEKPREIYHPPKREANHKLYESTTPSIVFPATLTGLTYKHTLAGGSGGVHVVELNGQTFTLKCVAESNSMKEEIMADALYRSLGVPVPEFAVYDHLPEEMEGNNCLGPGPYRLARFIPSGLIQSKDVLKEKMQHYFMADAFLANWDIVIGDFKNVILDAQGTLWRIDNGGSLRYRALGGLKIDHTPGWNPNKVGELETMRDLQINEGAWVYQGIPEAQLKQQAEALWARKDQLFTTLDDVSRAIQVENPGEVRVMLRNRLDDLAERFKIQVQAHRSMPTGKWSLASADAPATDKTAAGILTYNQNPITNSVMVLLGKRINHNWWGNLGGRSELGGETPDKTLADTAAREIQEESIGLITYSALALKTYPSHDLVNNDGVVYRMYLAPHGYLDPEKLMKEPKVPEHHWEQEYTEFKWVPLSKILEALRQATVIQEEGESTIAVEGLILHPPLWHMLKEPPVLEALNVIQNNKKPRPTHTQGVDKTLTPTTFTQEREQLAEQVVRHGQVMAEMKKGVGIGREPSDKIETMKGVISEANAQKVRKELSAIPLSQSEAHLVESLGKNFSTSSADEVKAFLNYDKAHPDLIKDANYVTALTAALDMEKQHKDKIVFYHGTDAQVSFLYDVYTELRAQLSALSPDKLKSFRILEKPFENILDVDAFIQAFTQGGEVSNYTRNYQELGLSFNLFLFGSHKVEGSETYLWFYTAGSAMKFTIDHLMSSFTSSVIPLTVRNYKSLFNQTYRDNNNTKLVQVFIDPRVVDAVAYMAVTEGDVVRIKDPTTQSGTYYGFLKTIPQIRKDPKAALSLFAGSQSAKGEIPNLDHLQARLFVKPEIFSRPEFVQIHTYWRHPLTAKQEQNYKKQLKELVAQDIKQALLTPGTLHSSEFAEGNPPLKILHKQVEQGQLGIMRGTEEEVTLEEKMTPEEKMAMALLTGNTQRITQLLKENPDMHFKSNVNTIVYGAQRKRVVKNQPLYLYSSVGGTALHEAASKGLLDLIKLLWQSEPKLFTEPLVRDQVGLTPLFTAVASGNIGVIKLLSQLAPKLLEEPLVRVNNGSTPLFEAVASGNIEVIKLLSQLAPQLFAEPLVRVNDGSTPLFKAVVSGNIEVIKLLSQLAPQLFAEPLARKEDGTPLLFYASGMVEVIKLLSDIAPQLFKKPLVLDKNGDTLFHTLSAWGREEMLAKLLAYPTTRKLLLHEDMFLGQDRNTPLHTAAEWSNDNLRKLMPTIKALLNDSDVRALAFKYWTNTLGKTPIDKAFKQPVKTLLKDAYDEYLKSSKK